MITTKSTKAEILAAYKNVSEAYAADRAQAIAPVITAEAAANSATVVWSELVALVQDTYRFGAWCRKGFDQVLDEMKLIVKN